MKPTDLLKYYAHQRAVSLRLGVTEQAVGQWFKAGRIPKLRQYEIERLHPLLRVDTKITKELMA